MNARATALSRVSAITVLSFACAPAADDMQQEPSQAEPEVIVGGLNGPMGILVEPDGTIWVVDSGVGGDQVVATPDPVSREMAEASFGETSRILQIDPSGEQIVFAHLPSLLVGGTAYGGARLAMLDGVLYATSGGWMHGSEDYQPDHSGVIRVERDQLTPIVHTRDLEIAQNPDPAQLQTNPYGLAVGPDRLLWMTDAAGNTLYRVDPEARSLELIAVFDVSPGTVPNPARNGAMEVEPVPTGIAFLDGEAYVSFLPGLPMSNGSAKIVRLADDGTVTEYATDLTRLTDLQPGPDGNLYAVSLGTADGTGPTGSVIRIGRGTTSEVVLSELSFPTAVAFDADGNAYVTVNGVGAPGSGQVIKYTGIARVSR